MKKLQTLQTRTLRQIKYFPLKTKTSAILLNILILFCYKKLFLFNFLYRLGWKAEFSLSAELPGLNSDKIIIIIIFKLIHLIQKKYP